MRCRQILVGIGVFTLISTLACSSDSDAPLLTDQETEEPVRLDTGCTECRDAKVDQNDRDLGFSGPDGASDMELEDDAQVSDAGEGDVADAGADTGTAEVDCSQRALLGQGALSNWRQKTTGPNSCVWKLPTQGGGLDADADCRYFDQVWPKPWPGSQNSRNLTVSGNQGYQFIAMEFDSAQIPAAHNSGRMTQEVPQFAGANGGNKIWSISECPGDFNKDLLDAEMGPGCIRRDQFGITQSFDWGGTDFTQDSSRCALEPNTRYYLNLVWSDDQAGTPPDQIQPNPLCDDRCGGIFGPVGLY